MQRFYIENLNTTNYNLVLKNKEIIQQLTKVLRSKIWDKIILFDWIDLKDYIFEIKKILKKEIILEQIDRIQKDSEINFELNLYQALPNKLDKIEYILQKGTEIWFTSFTFFRSDRSQKLILSNNKIERLNNIIIEAVEQSWRNKVPKLNIIPSLAFWTWLKIPWENIFFHTQDNKSINIKVLEIQKENWVNLFVWPEWGWGENEIKIFEENNFKKVYLWNRILRTETVWNVVWFCIINKEA